MTERSLVHGVTLAVVLALSACATTGGAGQALSGPEGLYRQVLALSDGLADAAERLERERAAAREAGIPLTAAEIRRPPLPDDQNAAVLYRQLERLDAEQHALVRRLTVRRGFTEADLAAGRRLLEELRERRDLIRRASALPEADFQWDLDAGPELELPELLALRDAVALLRAEAFLLGQEGKVGEAVTVLGSGFRLAEHLASEPHATPLVVAARCHGELVAGAQDLLYLRGAEAAGPVRELFAAHSPRLDPERALKGEVVLSLASIRTVRQGGPRLLGEVVFPWRAPQEVERLPALEELNPAERRAFDRFMDASEARLLRYLREPLAALALPSYRERRAALERVDAELAREPERDPTALLAGLLTVPIQHFAADAPAREAARAKVTGAAAALLAYRVREGRFPERLEEALPEPPLDPFTGEPLRYRLEDAGFVLYGVGPEGDVDGGPAGDWPPPEQAAFRYPAPPPEPYRGGGRVRRE